MTTKRVLFLDDNAADLIDVDVARQLRSQYDIDCLTVDPNAPIQSAVALLRKYPDTVGLLTDSCLITDRNADGRRRLTGRYVGKLRVLAPRLVVGLRASDLTEEKRNFARAAGFAMCLSKSDPLDDFFRLIIQSAAEPLAVREKLSQTLDVFASLTAAQRNAYRGKVLVVSGRPERILLVADNLSDAESQVRESQFAQKRCRFIQGPPVDDGTDLDVLDW